MIGLEKGIEYSASKLIDYLIDKSGSEIKSAFVEADRRKILKRACESFASMTHSTSEYPAMQFMKDSYDLSNLSEDDLEPNKKVEELSTIIKPFVKSCLSCQEEPPWDNIVLNVAYYYKKSALVTIGLKDIAIMLDSVDENIGSSFNVLQNMLTENKRKDEEDKIRKKRIFEKYIQNRVNELIVVLTEHTYHLVFKKGFSCKGNVNPVRECLKYMQDMIEQNDSKLCDIDYWKKPVELMIGVNECLEPTYISVLPSEFIKQYKMNVQEKILELMRYESFLPESIYYAVMELDLNVRNDLCMKYIDQTATLMYHTHYQTDDIRSVLVGWCQRALDIGKYYKE